MGNIFFSDWNSVIRIIIISIFAYPALIAVLRISGKRTLSKMNSFDFIVTIAIGSILATVILNKNVALIEGVLAFGLLIFFQFLITYFTIRNKRINDLVKSTPSLMAYNGKLIKKNLYKERIGEDEIRSTLRKYGYSSLEQTSAVVLETNGNLTVIGQIPNPESKTIKELQLP